MAFPLTREQQEIVNDRGGELLVSAAAGSGKTRVLVERLLNRVTEEGVDIDQFLVITYTKAAAAELRGRIAQELSQRLGENPNDQHLRRQTTLVYKAQISTIHAFCSSFLREYGHLLDLDPDFRQCDENEATLLMAQVLEDVLEENYKKITDGCAFSLLVDTMAAGRDDRKLAQIVLDVYGRIQSHPNPMQWLQEQKEQWALDGIQDAGETVWGQLILDNVGKQVQDSVRKLEQALGMCQQDELLSQNYAPSIQATLEELDTLSLAIKTGWDAVYACLPISFPAVGRKRKRTVELSPMEEEQVAQLTQRVKGLRERAKKQLSSLADQMEGDSSQVLEDMHLTQPAVLGLLDLVGEFRTAYTEEKRKRSLLDFSDLEHCTVQLLYDEQTGAYSQLAKGVGERFVEVMVDEYQDTNQVQNAIFTAISEDGNRLFQVGDVKQSIYRFRLADPTIFLDKFNRYPMGTEKEETQPHKRVLSQNFRSRAQVLEGCNDLFRNIMSTEFGELDYTEEQALVPGATFPDGEDYKLELNLYDLSYQDDLEEQNRMDKNALEAKEVARRIRQLLQKPLLIQGGQEQRPLRPSDVMILLRSPGVVMHHYVRALEQEGIPWNAEGGDDFFESSEINVALSLLQVVDNPRQDVPLIAVLRSPVYGFEADELAVMRAGCKGDFYTALMRAAEEGNEKCRNFVRELDALRFGAADRTCTQLIWHIYETCNLMGLFGALPEGEVRQEHLYTLYALARQMEHNGCRTLFQFLLRLERMRTNGSKIQTGNSGREGEGVSILSIHRSKGLEKPVVFVCGLSRRLNQEDMRRPVLFHPVLGLGPRGLEQSRMVEYPTLARKAVAQKLEQEMMAEELRLLYVAMTRAKEKLVLSIALREGARELERLSGDVAVPVSPIALEQQMSVAQWILLHVLTRPEAQNLRELAGASGLPIADKLGPQWDIHWKVLQQEAEDTEQEGYYTDAPQQQEQEEQTLLEALNWFYPHSAAVQMPSKLTATQLKGRSVDEESRQETREIVPQTARAVEIYRPQFIAKERGLSGAQKGIALHLAMQYIPLDGDHSRQGIQKELDRLKAGNYLTQLQYEAISPRTLSIFFQSELGKRLKQAKNKRREFKFSLLVPAERYEVGVEGEQVLLQGVIDCWFEEKDGITLLDFKSDFVTKGQEAVCAQRYRPQLEAYAMALETITGKKVQHKILWFFGTGTAYELNEK